MKKTIKQQIEDDEIFFCHMPWTMVYSEVDGYWQTCCHAKNTQQLGLPDNLNNLKVTNTSPEQWMKSDFQNKLRDEMLDPNSDHKIINEVCRRCKTEEKKYGESRRLRKMRSMLTNKKYHSDIMKAVEMYKYRVDLISMKEYLKHK